METELNTLKNYLLGLENLNERTKKVIRIAVDYVLDGEETIDDLEGCEKTILGTKVEKKFLAEFDLPKKITKKKMARLKKLGQEVKNPKLDTEIQSIDVDIKNSVGDSWMIPQECFDQWCLLFQVNFDSSTFSMGLLKMVPENITKKGNRDTKRSISADGKRNIDWLISKQNF